MTDSQKLEEILRSTLVVGNEGGIKYAIKKILDWNSAKVKQLQDTCYAAEDFISKTPYPSTFADQELARDKFFELLNKTK